MQPVRPIIPFPVGHSTAAPGTFFARAGGWEVDPKLKSHLRGLPQVWYSGIEYQLSDNAAVDSFAPADAAADGARRARVSSALF